MSLRILNIQRRSKKQTQRTIHKTFDPQSTHKDWVHSVSATPRRFLHLFLPANKHRDFTSRFSSLSSTISILLPRFLSSHNLGQVLRWSQDFFILNICDCKFRYRSNSQNGSPTWSYPRRRHCIYPLPLRRFFGKFLVFGFECCLLNKFPRFGICSSFCNKKFLWLM